MDVWESGRKDDDEGRCEMMMRRSSGGISLSFAMVEMVCRFDLARDVVMPRWFVDKQVTESLDLEVN